MDKFALRSKTIQGIIISCLPVLTYLGVEISQDEVVSIFDNIGVLVVAAFNVYGAIKVVIGRIEAKGGIHFDITKK